MRLKTFEEELQSMNAEEKRMILKEAKELGITFREAAERHIIPPLLIQDDETMLYEGLTEEEVLKQHPRAILIVCNK